MKLLFGTVSEILDRNTRLIRCSADTGHGQFTGYLLFSHHNIEVGDKVLIFVLSSAGGTSNYFIPFAIKNEHTLDNIRLFFTPDTSIYLDQEKIVIDKSYSEDNENNSENEDDSENKKSNKIFIDKDNINIEKNDMAKININDERMLLSKLDSDGNEVAKVLVSEENIEIIKQSDSDVAKIVITDTDMNVESKNISIKCINGGYTEIPGTPQASSTPEGGFSQILYCPFTGLPHTTKKLISS